jgi:aquaglyceroporin related protein
MIAILIGLSTNLAVQTSKDTAGAYQSVDLACDIGITIGIYIAGGISSGQLNPAISLTLCLYRASLSPKALVHISAQILGGILVGLVAYSVYRDAILVFDVSDGKSGLFEGGTRKTFFTQLGPFASVGTEFANEFVGAAILSCTILALGDDSNAPRGAGMHALIVGLVVTVLTLSFRYDTGACLNPARDFGPRIATRPPFEVATQIKCFVSARSSKLISKYSQASKPLE